MRLCPALVVSVLLAAHAGAQQPSRPRSVPSRPIVQVPVDPRDAGFPAWREANVSRAREPLAVRSPRFELLIASPLANERARRGGAIAGPIDRCAARFGLNARQIETLKTLDAWAAFDSAANGPYVTITVLPVEAKRVKCDDNALEREALIRTGLRFGLDEIVNPNSDVAFVEVHQGGRELPIALAGRALVTKVAPQGYAGSDGSSMVRLYIAYDDIAPVPGPDTVGLEVRIWNESYAEPHAVIIPPSVLDELWHEALVWRARRAADESRAVTPLAGEFPQPADAALREAHAAYVAARVPAALDLALVRLEGERLSRDDALSARVHVGAGFLALGDWPAARAAFGAALDADPCLRFADNVAAPIRALVDSLRPPIRCTPMTTREVLRTALRPGRAQRVHEPTRVDAADAYRNLTIGLAAASVASHILARSLHASYDDDLENPARAYRVADERRQIGNALGLLTYAAWATAALHAVAVERAYARRLTEVGSYGAARGDGSTGSAGAERPAPVEVRPSTRGVGLAIHFF